MAYAEVTNPGLDLAAYWAGLSGLSWRGTDLSLKPGSIPRVTLRKFRWQIARGELAHAPAHGAAPPCGLMEPKSN